MGVTCPCRSANSGRRTGSGKANAQLAIRLPHAPQHKERDTVSGPLPASPGAPDAERASLRRFSRLLFALGLVSILIGVLAILAPHVATSKAVVFLGALLVVAGVSEAIHAVLVRNLRGFAMHLLAAALYLLVGLFVLEDPERVAGVLTLLLAAFFFAGGLLRIIFSLVEHFPAWPWVLLNGVVDLILGVLIWR